jgi:hypothetical protein
MQLQGLPSARSEGKWSEKGDPEFLGILQAGKDSILYLNRSGSPT